VQDLDREVVLGLAHHVARLPLEDHAGSVVGIDDVVADLELAHMGSEILEILEARLLYCCLCDVRLLK
jgi:hypothetical protein